METVETTTNLGLTTTEIKNCCQRVLLENNSENIQILECEANGIGGAPSGFLGRHQILNILIEQKSPDGINQHKLNFFLKSAPEDVSAQMKYIEEFGAFKKEVAFYKTIIPRLQDINIASSPFTPKCFLGKKNYLLFENLVAQGYRLGAKIDGLLDYEQLNCGLKSIANLHSASIIHEIRTGKSSFDLYENILQENAYPDDPNKLRYIVMDKACRGVCELIKIIPKYKNLDNLEEILNKFCLKMRTIFELCKTSKKYKNCISHGDLWANNVMFKYENSKLTECRLVDFQLARYAPPILDVITWLTIPTSKIFREKYLNELLNNYWNYMLIFLHKQNIQLEDIITKREFNKSIEEFKVAGLIESILFSHLTILPIEITKDMLKNSNDFDDFINNRRGEVCSKAFINNEVYRNRLTDMISDFIDTYVL